MTEASMNFEAQVAKAQANNAKLNSCSRHLFDTEVPGIEGGVASMFGRKMVCKKCKGEIDLLHLNQYICGYEAAGKNGNDILPGWKPNKIGRAHV